MNRGERADWLALLAVSAGLANAILSASIFNVASPFLMRDFGLAAGEVHWVVTGYMAAMTVAMLPSAWLVDRWGYRPVFQAGLLVLALASLLGAFSTGFAGVMAMRLLQGLACGVLMPMGMLLVVRRFPVSVQGRAAGLLGFGYVLSPAIAPLLGGVLADGWGWRGIFLATAPGGALLFLACHFLLPAEEISAQRRDFDWAGFGLLLLLVLSTVLAAILSPNEAMYALKIGLGGALTAVLAWALLRHLRRAAHPLLDLAVFAEPDYRLGSVISFIYGIGIYGATYVVPLYLQTELGYDATTAGSALLPAGAALAVSMPLAGYWADRFRVERQMAIGLLVYSLSFCVLAYLTAQPVLAWLALTLAVGRFSLGVMLPALNIATLQCLPSGMSAQGSSMMNCLRQIGGALGIAASAGFLGWRTRGGAAGASAYAEAFLAYAFLFALAMMVATRMRSKPKRREK